MKFNVVIGTLQGEICFGRGEVLSSGGRHGLRPGPDLKRQILNLGL